MGLVPGAGGTASIVGRIGRHRTAYMALGADAVGAPTALEWGLVDAVRTLPGIGEDPSAVVSGQAGRDRSVVTVCTVTPPSSSRNRVSTTLVRPLVVTSLLSRSNSGPVTGARYSSRMLVVASHTGFVESNELCTVAMATKST